MTKPAAITANLVDVRNVGAHKCVELKIHVPFEQAPEVIEAFGWPTMAMPVPVAIAKLNLKGSPERLEIENPKERRAFCDLPYPQQAALKPNDLKFQLWMSKTPIGKEAEDTAEAIRLFCGVTSRANILRGTHAGDRWIELLRAYEREAP